MLFKRKKEDKCFHKYKDFPWYTVIRNYRKDDFYDRWKVVLYEPYVCVHCGERIDVVLAEWADYTSYESAANARQKINKEYAEHIRDRAIIEDMVNDMILVDQQYLKFYDMVRNGKIELPKLELK